MVKVTPSFPDQTENAQCSTSKLANKLSSCLCRSVLFHPSALREFSPLWLSFAACKLKLNVLMLFHGSTVIYWSMIDRKLDYDRNECKLHALFQLFIFATKKGLTKCMKSTSVCACFTVKFIFFHQTSCSAAA